MRSLLLAFLMACALLNPVKGAAHALDPGYLNLIALGDDRWRVTWRVPNLSGTPMQIEARLPQSCSSQNQPSPVFDGRAWTRVWIATCPGGIIGGQIKIEGLENTNTDTLVRYELTPGDTKVHRLTAAATTFIVPAEAGVLDILASYTSLGVTHILEGFDHLLFVLALLLLIRDRARLFWTITAFTAAHSLTLAGATLGWMRIPSPPVEAVIALSIVFLAYELTLPEERRDQVISRFPWIVSFAFGLIHGLGFAGALREIGLPEGDIPLALLAFNVGVELGQVLFITFVLAIGAFFAKVYPALRKRGVFLTRSSSYVIGTIAAFWVIERIAAF